MNPTRNNSRLSACYFPYAKIVQVNAMKVYFVIAERRLSYAKIVQVNAMKARFLIAERRLSYAKVQNNL